MKKGSKSFPFISSEMPTPVSLTERTTKLFSCSLLTVILPPSGMASMALKIIFTSASLSSAASPATGATSFSSVPISMVTPSVSSSFTRRDSTISKAPSIN
ncbi:hypothetical protein ES703_121368 [subsurface metagenome]